MEQQIMETKYLRKSIDEIIQRVKALDKCRETSIVVTKLQEAVMWLGMNLKRINELQGGEDTNPYPSSKEPYRVEYTNAVEELVDVVINEWENLGWDCIGKVWDSTNKRYNLTFQKPNTKIEPTADGLKL